MRGILFKKWYIPGMLAIVVLLTLAIVACGDDEPEEAAAPSSAPAAAPAATATPVPVAAPAGAYPEPGAGGVPASVDRVTIAVDDWGSDELNPWILTSTMFLQDLFNLRIMQQDTDGSTVGLWATEFDLTDEGVRFQIHPDAKFQDGSVADAEALADNIRGFRGDYIGQYGYENILWNGSQLEDAVKSLDVISPTELFVATNRPFPAFMENFGGNAYHLFWYGNPAQIKKGNEEYIKDPAGGGQYKIKEWKPAESMLFERWEDFWADYDWYKKPQAKEMELLEVADHTARYALLKSGQVDVVYNIPWAIAKDLVRSEDTARGVNPGGTDIWTHTYQGAGHLQMTFILPLLERESALPEGLKDEGGLEIRHYDFPEQYRGDPTLDVRVREALNLAIDKRSISENAHFGLSLASGSIFSPGSFGWRDDVGFNPSPYDPERAKELLAEAGYADGFSLTGHFGQFAGRPGIPEATDAIASYWEKVGVTVTWQEHEPGDYVRGIRVRGWPQVMVPTFGRQEHSGVRLNDSYHSTAGYIAVWDEEIDRLFFLGTGTTDKQEQLDHIAGLEDYVLSLKETFPLYAMSLITGYSDRVLAHPTVEFSPHPKNWDRLVLKD